MAKRVSAQRVKLHRQYTYEGAAEELGVTVQTVRSWRKEGLVVLDSQKPHLILGHDLKSYIQDRSLGASFTLGADEFYCMSCRAPKRAYGAMVDYVSYTTTRGRMEALCETCQVPCGKFATLQSCYDLAAILTIVIRNRS